MKFFLSLLLIFPLLSSCSSNPAGYEVHGPDQFVIDSYKIKEGKFSILEMIGKEIEELPNDAMNEYKDIIYDDDILTLTLYHPTRKDIVSSVNIISETIGYQVIDGYITLPDLPPIEVRNLSLSEARKIIERQYLEQIQDVEVFIAFKRRLVRKVELMGMVSIPALPVNGKLRLFEVLSLAKIPKNANLFMSYVIRENKPLKIDLQQLIKEGDLRHNIVMKGGDKIYIADPDDAKIMLMGEVGSPRAISLPSGFISLREALVMAGGIPFTGDKSYIQVIRGDLAKPKIYTLNWNIIINLPNNSLLLMPGDTIYVSAKPITEWNRFLSQLLPSFSGLQAGYGTSKIVGL
jgi:polysaccharide biosynthesis/export protein